MKKDDRKVVFNRFGGRCAYCGDPLVSGWHADHLIPCRRRYKEVVGWGEVNGLYPEFTRQEVNKMTPEEFEAAGVKFYTRPRMVADGYDNPAANCLANMYPACKSCNINKSTLDVEGFRALINGFMKHLNEINTQYKFAKRYGLVLEDPQPVVFFFETFDKLPEQIKLL